MLPCLDALRRHLETHFAEDAVVLGPAVDLSSALALAESMRVTRPPLGVILVRRRVDTSVLTDALRSGVFEVVDERDLAGAHHRRRRARELARALREPSGSAADQDGRRHGRVVTVFSAKGGCGKTTLATNLAVAARRPGTPRGLPRRPRPRLRRRRHRAAAFPRTPSPTPSRWPTRSTAPRVGSLLTPHSPGLTTLVAPIEPGTAESIPAIW